MTDPTPRTETGRPPLDPATKHDDDVYMAGLIRGRELEREAAAQARTEALDVEVLARALEVVPEGTNYVSRYADRIAARYLAILAETER